MVDDAHREVIRAANDPTSRPVRVIAVNKRLPLTPPAELTILSMECWTTFLVVHWFFVTSEASDEVGQRLQDGLEWHGEDDVGGVYLGGDYGGGGGASTRWTRTAWLAPHLDPGTGSQGQWAADDLSIATDAAATLAPRQHAVFDLPPGSSSVVHMPDGSTVVATRFWVRNNGSGTWH